MSQKPGVLKILKLMLELHMYVLKQIALGLVWSSNPLGGIDISQTVQ